MAQLDPNLILRAGQTADVMGAVTQGNALAGQAIEMQRGNALNAFLQENGQGLLSGDQNALTGLAQFDPTMALNIQTQNRNNARADEQLAFDRQRLAQQDQRQVTQDQRADQEWQFKVEEYKRGISAEQAAAEAAQIEDAVKMGLAAQTPEQWDAMMAQQSPDLVGQFDQRDALAQRYMSVAEILKGQNPAPLSAPGKVQADIAAGILPADTPLRGAGQTINVGDGSPGLGKLSTDYGYVLDPGTGQPKIDPNTGLPMAAPVPGSPAAREAEANETKTETRQTQAANSASVVLQDIDRAIGQVSGWTAGPGSVLAAIPGSGARDMQASLDTVRANIGFDRLQQMREASPTGGALGGIAIQELQMLQAVLGSLDTAQSPEQLRDNLTRLKQIYEPIAEKAAAYPNAAEFGFGGQPDADLSDDDLLKKYGG